MSRDQVFRWGGVVAGAVLMAFGIVVIVLAINGHNTVTTELKQQKIAGTPDMTPSAIKAEGPRQASRTSATRVHRRWANSRCRQRGALLRPVHEHPCTGGDRRLRVLGDGPVPGKAGRAKIAARAGGGRATPTTQSPISSASLCQTEPGTSGSPRPRSRPRSTRVTWRLSFAVQPRRRHRTHPRRDRVRHPRAGRDGSTTERGASRQHRLRARADRARDELGIKRGRCV